MSERPVKILLEDVLDSIRKIESFLNSTDFEHFQNNEMMSDAVIRNIEVIGEAINKLPETFLNTHNEVEWHKAISMRNRLIHAYFEIDYQIVWNTCKSILPSLRIQIDGLLNKL